MTDKDNAWVEPTIRKILDIRDRYAASIIAQGVLSDDSTDHLILEVAKREINVELEAFNAMLDRVEAESGLAVPALERVLESFLLPMAEAADQYPQFVKLMGRMYAEGMMPAITRKHFHTVACRFVGTLRKALPELPEEELGWRIHFMIGAMAHAMCGVPLFPTLADVSAAGLTGDFRTRIDRLLRFLSAGFRAPVLKT